MKLSRRAFGWWLGLGVAAAAAGRRWWISAEARLPLTGDVYGAAQHLAGLYRNPESAAVVGRAYLRAAPGEKDLDALVRRVAAALGVTPDEIRRTDRRELAARFRSRQRSDFAEGNIVYVRQWMLSRTEARLAALVALVDRK